MYNHVVGKGFVAVVIESTDSNRELMKRSRKIPNNTTNRTERGGDATSG